MALLRGEQDLGTLGHSHPTSVHDQGHGAPDVSRAHRGAVPPHCASANRGGYRAVLDALRGVPPHAGGDDVASHLADTHIGAGARERER
jgi:hypothetical protein